MAVAAIHPRRSRSARRKSSPPPSNSRATRTRPQQQAADIAKLLSQSQATLHDQAVTLSGRLQARELTDEVQAISDFQKDMIAASAAMAPAAQQLQQQKWKDAIPNEQKALQFLLRAEATFRQIQVAFGARGGGGGGGGGAARDLAALFDLELDTEKNQYETRQSASTTRRTKGAGNRRRAEEARRTGQARRGSGPAAAQRRADRRAEMAAGDVAARGASSCSGRWSSSSVKMASRASRASRAKQQAAKQGSRASGRAARAASRAAQRQQAGRQQAIRSSPRTKPPTAANRRRNRRSIACARPTTTCGAPPPRMPARPIPAAPPTACAKPPTCWAACSSRTPPAASTRWRRRPINWRPGKSSRPITCAT